MRSKALNRAFNRALIDQEYRHALLSNLRTMLLGEGVPEKEIHSLEAFKPRTIRDFAQALEAMHVATFN